MNITTPFTLKPHFYLRATIVACLISVVAWAQPQKFQKVYGGYSYDQGNDLIQLPERIASKMSEKCFIEYTFPEIRLPNFDANFSMVDHEIDHGRCNK